MTLRTKTIASACAMLTLGLAGAVSAQPAQARWIFHDDRIGVTITAPSGGTRVQTCTTRLKAESGYGHFIAAGGGEDPAAFQVPPDALAAVDYEVWKAPDGFDNLNLASHDAATGGFYFMDSGGTRHDATLLTRVTTAPRALLPVPEPAAGNPHTNDVFVYTSARISARLSGVEPGDMIGLRPARNPTFDMVSAMNCRLPIVKAKVDVIPGSKANKVHPASGNELIPVRIFGSKRLRVKKIKAVHLGEAKPASVPSDLKASLRPKDVNRDGRLDRLYYFRQGDTDIMCIDTRVKVTGRTSNKKYFQAKAPIATAGCSG